jgi:hypothetical protein
MVDGAHGDGQDVLPREIRLIHEVPQVIWCALVPRDRSDVEFNIRRLPRVFVRHRRMLMDSGKTQNAHKDIVIGPPTN